jgi:predicted HTH transcriptional regulator
MIDIIDFNGNKFKHYESDEVELKESVNIGLFDKYKETICAFLNNNGGNLIFGIKDNLDIVGLRDNVELDKFVCRLDAIISGGLIVCYEEDSNNKNIVNILPDAIKTKIIINDVGKKFLLVIVKREDGMEYQLNNGQIFHRLNASNYNVRSDKLYTQSQLNLSVRVMEKELRKMHKKHIDEKDKEIFKLKKELENIKMEINDSENYLVKPLMDKINESIDEYGFGCIWNYFL